MKLPVGGLLSVLEIRITFIYSLFKSLHVDILYNYLYILKCIASYIIASHDKFYLEKEKEITELIFDLNALEILQKYKNILKLRYTDELEWANNIFEILGNKSIY